MNIKNIIPIVLLSLMVLPSMAQEKKKSDKSLLEEAEMRVEDAADRFNALRKELRGDVDYTRDKVRVMLERTVDDLTDGPHMSEIRDELEDIATEVGELRGEVDEATDDELEDLKVRTKKRLDEIDTRLEEISTKADKEKK